ncbi:hypothetical protein EB001_25125 [bacterium]|nr:hypothetical protein [bacterium]
MSKVRVKEVKRAVGDVNINGMFEEMLGVKDAEKSIIIPKFVFVRNTLRHIYRVFIQFHDMLIKDFGQFSEGLEDVKKFAEELKESTYLKHDHEEKETAYDSVEQADMNGLYRKLKENQYVKSLVVLCSNLNRYQNNFTDSKALKLNFINQEPGLTFNMFSFSRLDFKALWASNNMKESVKRYVLMVLASIHKHTHALYKCITSPDIDVEKFTVVLVSAIGELRKHPRLHRCHNAFKRIEQSVELLKEKFNDYYRESVASQNPDMIVMNFIIDVSNQGGANATLTREFRTIIQYMHEASQKSGKTKDPNIQKVFNMLNSNFALMEQKTGIKTTPFTEEENAAGNGTGDTAGNVAGNGTGDTAGNVAGNGTSNGTGNTATDEVSKANKEKQRAKNALKKKKKRANKLANKVVESADAEAGDAEAGDAEAGDAEAEAEEVVSDVEAEEVESGDTDAAEAGNAVEAGDAAAETGTIE